MFFDIALLAYLFDKLFGEFPIKHPVVWMGEFIQAYERRFYRDTIWCGGLLVAWLLGITFLVVYGFSYLVTITLPNYIGWIILSLIASTGIAMNMLYDSVRTVLTAKSPKMALGMLVSRETAQMTEEEVYKACLETWAENLSDGVIAPLFYLTLFGLEGIAIYKAINTLDSMVGYKTARYERFGKIAARLDDIANYIPARLTALLIALISFNLSALKTMWQDGGKLESPNAGFPIAALAGALDVTLGGDAIYHGKLKKKPSLGKGNRTLTATKVIQALQMRSYFDGVILVILLIGLIFL
jgi:adenosylcobinamide-phosphate synthase